MRRGEHGRGDAALTGKTVLEGRVRAADDVAVALVLEHDDHDMLDLGGRRPLGPAKSPAGRRGAHGGCRQAGPGGQQSEEQDQPRDRGEPAPRPAGSSLIRHDLTVSHALSSHRTPPRGDRNSAREA
jgi:hypothetical protein